MYSLQKSVREHFIKIEFKDNSLADVFEKIEQKTGYHFAYEKSEIAKNIKIETVLNKPTVNINTSLFILFFILTSLLYSLILIEHSFMSNS